MTRLDDLYALRSRVDSQITTELRRMEKQARKATRSEVEMLSKDRRTIRHLLVGALSVTGVTRPEILSCSKEKPVVRARWAVLWAASSQGMSYAEIGRQMGRDHTSVMHAVRTVSADPELLSVAKLVEKFASVNETAA